MVIRLQHRSMGCSDSSLAPRRKFSALPMANECLFYTLAGTKYPGFKLLCSQADAEHQWRQQVVKLE